MHLRKKENKNNMFTIHFEGIFIYFFLNFSFIYLFLAVLDLRSCTGFSLAVPSTSRGYFIVARLRLLIVVASPVSEHRLLDTWASVVAALRF